MASYSLFWMLLLKNNWKLISNDFVIYLWTLAVTVIRIYWIFFVPLVWKKDLDNEKCSFLRKTENAVGGYNPKRDTINRLRKLKIQKITELPPPYPNGWYGILKSSQLKAGEATCVSCLGEDLVIFRTKKNIVFILDAYCPHLGANLGIGGSVADDCVICPFHQWKFRGTDGLCINIPYSTSVPKGSKVKKWISQEVDGFIFIWYHAEQTELPWDLREPMGEIDDAFVYHGHNEFYINCHIQEIPENGADIAHFNAIHKKNFINGSWVQKKRLFGLGSHHWKARWSPLVGKLKYLAEVNLNHYFKLFGKFDCFRMEVSGKQIGPSIVCLEVNSYTFGKIKVVQYITPIEPLLQKVVHEFYGPRWIAPLMKIFIYGESLMFERDISIWNHKVFHRNPILAKEDASIKKFRLWFSQFYSSNSKLYSETTNIDCQQDKHGFETDG
ncbi:cholesterol 7-desaturase isoform X3 [Drosophila sechellia]|uniref:cholesterol 7-desaturase isoform X3 n=1 Tax=Drosophila sechellia TaxID=7238 RepID=UPI0013DDBD18|nr:cholesterol 7-desaturase isoform X3 [Drosophila sechellia]XP_032574747.1 cholesterol 7-desaturase isoform X3 [Drosophila sechellia]